jgi:iron(III) transport system substrate-binding protein
MRIRRRTAALGLALAACGACGGDDRTVLTVYSPHGRELLDHFERAFERANPGVDVRWVEMGSEEVLERVRAEAADPQADLWFGAPADAFERAAAENLLEPYRPTWAAAVGADARDSLDRWYGAYITPQVIAYNTEHVPAAQAPRDWDDVLDPRWKGRIIIRDPAASGSMRAIFVGIMARETARTGSSRAGYDWLRRLDANTREYAFNPSILHERLRRGDGVLTLYNMPDMAMLRQRQNAPVAYVIPASGTPVLVDGIALVRGAKHPESARRFYEFVTTPEALLYAADSLLRIPARTDLPAARLPSWIREATPLLKPLPVDRRLVADSAEAWMRYWDTNIRSRNRS